MVTHRAAQDRGMRLFREYPTATLIALPYALLILPQAVVFGNPDVAYICITLGIALIPALVVEVLSRRRSRVPLAGTFARRDVKILATAGAIVTSIGAISVVLRALAGVGSVFAQVGRGSSSSLLMTALSSLTPLMTVGIALIGFAYIVGACSRVTCLIWVAIALSCQAIASYLLAITAPFFGFAIAVVLILLYLGVIGIRHCVMAGIAILVLWPTIYALRNEARVAGGVAVSSRMGAFDRLRYDLQITRGADLGHGIDIATPGPLEIIRYGLVPRFLDPGRPSLSTGVALNVYLGGTSESAYTFLPVATAYVLEGPAVVALLYGAWAVFVRLLMKCGNYVTWTRISLLALLIDGPLGWFATYPDATIGFVQSVVSLGLVGLLVGCLRLSARTRESYARDGPMHRRWFLGTRTTLTSR